MLINTVIYVTFGDPCAQQKSAITFRCSVLYHTEFDFHCIFIYVTEKMSSNTLHIFTFKGNTIRTDVVETVMSGSVVFIHLYFFAKNVAIDFC